MARLLVCRTHKTVDILPDYNTAQDMEGTHDYALQDRIRQHLDKYGSNPDTHGSIILSLTDAEMELLDPAKLKQALMDDSLETYIKDTRENYKEDAMSCYNLHNRPIVGFPGCPDYRDSSRAIGFTKGIPDEKRMYVCDFCPYQSYVDYEKRKAAGMYGK